MSKTEYSAKALIAEDNRLEAALLEEILKSFGCTVDISRGLDIVDNLDTLYDIIFLDVNMPGIDGFYIAANLKKTSKPNSETAIIIVSSDPYDKAVQKKCLASKADGYIQKPMTIPIIKDILDAYIPLKKIRILRGEDNNIKGFFRIK